MSCRVTVEERKSLDVGCGQVFDEISSYHVAYGKVNLILSKELHNICGCFVAVF